MFQLLNKLAGLLGRPRQAQTVEPASIETEVDLGRIGILTKLRATDCEFLDKTFKQYYQEIETKNGKYRQR